MDIAWFLLLLAAALAVAIGLVVALLVRARRAADLRLARRLSDLDERLDVLAHDLGHTAERARQDSLRARTVESLERAVEVDEVLARCAEAAASLPSVAVAVARIEIDGVPRVATAGFNALSAAAPDFGRADAAQPSHYSPTRYYYPAEEPGPAGVRPAVAVPLEVEGRQLGSLTVFGRGEEPPVAGDELEALQAISRRGAPALETARSLEGAERPGVVGDVPGLGTRETYHKTLALMAARARRRGRRLAICVVDLDDFRLLNERIGQIAGDRLLAEIADALRETARPTDLACRTGGDEFAVILPDSGRIDAESLFARLQATLDHRPAVRDAKVSLSAGIAELEADDDGVSLFERAVSALQEAKAARRGTAV
jgi:diguanylate cyclase (GGDEF)-like protein